MLEVTAVRDDDGLARSSLTSFKHALKMLVLPEPS
jgi:hypothetical protein